MNNSDDSWSRCAKEFPIPDVPSNNEHRLTREFDESIMRPVHVKRLDFNNGLFSSCRGVVAADIALASLREIERNELVSKWIADGMCTPPTSEKNTSCPPSPIFGNLIRKFEKLEGESVAGFVQNEPKIRDKTSQDFVKSPVIGKRKRISIGRSRFGSWDKLKLDESQSSCPSDKSPILGSSVGRHRPGIKRKRLQDRSDVDNNSLARSYLKENARPLVLGSLGTKEACAIAEELKVVDATEAKEETVPRIDGAELSQDIFDEEITTRSRKPGAIPCARNLYREIKLRQKEEEGDLFGSFEEVNEPFKNEYRSQEKEGLMDAESNHSPLPWKNNEYLSTPVIGLEPKPEANFSELNKVEERSFDSVIQDTEEFPVAKISRGRGFPHGNLSKRDDKFLILDSEFSIEKRKFVTDTEHIDCDTSSENEEDNRALKGERISTGLESDSDKTVSDIIEEPTTQDYSEPLKPSATVGSQFGMVSSCSRNSISATSPKISGTISSKDPITPQISFVNISVETTSPQTHEPFAPAPELLDSGKKKKSRPKKGSLGARLQKLISGQVSSVRLWRHQMSQESAFERSSAPCTTLLVVEAWMQYGKNLYRSKVLNDPYDLLNGCLDEPTAHSSKREEDVSRSLVVMTNPDFVGSVKLLPGTVFKIYLPWEVFNRNSGPGNLVLHALYFNVVSNPVKDKSETSNTESQAEKYSNELVAGGEVVRRYNCPCLENGKIDDSCLYKFTNHKINIIAEIIK